MGGSKTSKRPRRDSAAAADEPAAEAEPAAVGPAAAPPAAAPTTAATTAPAKKKPKKGSSAYWSSLGGWKSIAVTDQEIFLGADEGGFGGLEELDPRDVDAAALAELDAQAKALFGGAGDKKGAVVGPGGGGEDKKPKQQQKEKQQHQKPKQQQQQEKKEEKQEGDEDNGTPRQLSRKERRAAERRAYREEKLKQRAEERRARRAEARAEREAGGGQELGALKARLAALERENARLKQKKGDDDDDDDDDEGDDEGGSGSDGDDDKQTAATTTIADTSAWRRAFPGDWLHPALERALGMAGFSSPTAVQVAAVPGAARDRRDVICAAQTGSGKTLAFGLPILQRLLEERDRRREKEEEEEEEESGSEDGEDANAKPPATTTPTPKLRALILAPTRELGLQVAAHLSALATPLGIRVAALVGGLALPKQERLLAKGPEVVVATPGRLWDLMRQAHPHVSDLSSLSFLVIDEADRMVQRGHYAELGGILDLVPRGGGGGGGKKKSGGKSGGDKKAAAAAPGKGLENEEVPALENPDVQLAGAPNDDAPLHPAATAAPQTMVFSATLTLPAALRKRLRKGGGGQSGAATLDALMDRVPFRDAGAGGGRGPLIVDLTTARRLADRVHEAHVRCASDARRDAALALFLSAHPGRCVVFVNAVSSLRRLAALLRLLGLPAQALHAQQQQRQRLKALDRFRASAQGVLVATDVAARGLDVKGVESVVHYQLPASADTYIHRCGRTARTGGGEGVSLALVTPQEAARWRALRFALGGSGGVGGDGEQGQQQQDDEPAPCPEFPLDGALLREAERRLALAEKVDALERAARKRRAEQGWARSQAAAAGLALSDDEDEGGNGGEDEEEDAAAAASHLSPRDAAELARLRSQLAAAVAAPLQPAVSRRFFAGGASAGLLLQQNAGGGGGDDDDPAAATAAAADMAARLATNAAAAAAKNKKQAPAGGEAGAKKSTGAGSKREQERQRREAEQRRQQKLDRLLLSNNERKRRRRAAAQGTGRGMVVIGRPGVGGSSAAAMVAVAAGRASGGASALEALRGGVVKR